MVNRTETDAQAVIKKSCSVHHGKVFAIQFIAPDILLTCGAEGEMKVCAVTGMGTILTRSINVERGQ